LRRERKNDLDRAAVRLAEILGDQGALIGGMAVAAHGYVRATEDVDFVTGAPLSEVRRRLQDQGIAATLHRGEFDCLKGVLDGVSFDIITPPGLLDLDRAIEIPIRRGRLRVVPLETLIYLKLKAQGPRDLMDVAALVLLHPGQREHALAVARSEKALDRLQSWLSDPRLQSELRRAGRAAPRRRPKRGARRA
jgi:hypothetical protein